MLKDQCISITDLRTKTKECLEDLGKEPKYVFMNNQPIAVLLDINEYEECFLKPRLVEFKDHEVNETLKKAALKARKAKNSELMNI